MKKAVVLIIIFLLTAGFLSAQNSLGAVDIAAANAEIEQLKADIQESQDAIAKANADIDENEKKADELNKKIVEVNGYLSQIQEEIRDMADFRKRVADEELSKKTDDSLMRATGIKNNLKSRLQALTDELNVSRATIEESRRQIRVKNSVILRKQERIFMLETAIKLTEQQKAEGEKYISNVDSIISNAEDYLSDQ